MKDFITLLSIACIIYCGLKLKRLYLLKKFELHAFIVSYEMIKTMLVKRFMDYVVNKNCLISKVDDALTLVDIIQNNLKKEETEISKNPKKFYKKLYKEFKKEKNIQLFINKRFIGIANFLRCYGDTEWDILSDLKKMVA